jgi:hypothetical protein
MFDINTLVNAAINAAVQQAIAPLMERIDNLDAICQTQAERITALENQAIVTSNAVDARIAVLENNPAQGVDTSVVAGNYTPVSNEQVKALLQEWAATGGFVTRDQVEALIEAKMDLHLECYDHDSYDSAVSDFEDMPSLDDYVTRDEVRSEIEDVLNNATLSLSI